MFYNYGNQFKVNSLVVVTNIKMNDQPLSFQIHFLGLSLRSGLTDLYFQKCI